MQGKFLETPPPRHVAPGADPTASPRGHTYLSFLAALLLMGMWTMMGKISSLCRTQMQSRRAWVFWRGQGGRVKVLASEVVKGAHPREGGGEKSGGRSAVSMGACCAIKSLSLWFVIWGI